MKALIIFFISVIVMTVGLACTKEVFAQAQVSSKGLDRLDSAPQLAHIKQELLELHGERPELFEQVRATKGRVVDADRRRRGRFAPVAPIFRSLGAEAFLPMLYFIATDEPLNSAMEPRAWIAYRAGLIEAVGKYRDARAAPVLWAVLEGTDTQSLILYAAAEGIARLEEEAQIHRLIGWLEQLPLEQRAEIIGALGSARRLATAEHLARIAHTGVVHTGAVQTGAIQNEASLNVQRAAVRALGDLGNDWAWQTSRLMDRPEAQRLRTEVFEALFEIYLSTTQESLRSEALKSLLLVNLPEANRFVEQARNKADKERAARLDELDRRLNTNPLNRSVQP